jgi:hypothetical protein
MRRTRARGQLWAFMFLSLRRTLELVVLVFRSQESKEIELLTEGLWVPRTSSGPLSWDHSRSTDDRENGPWPSHSSIAFTRVLQLLWLSRSNDSDLAIEVVMLRHAVAVLRRKVARPTLRPEDRALLAGLSRLLTRVKLHRFFFFVQPDTLLR